MPSIYKNGKMPKSSSEKSAKATEYLSDIALQVNMEREHALIMSDIGETIGITEYQLGRPDTYEEAKALIREVCEGE